MCSIFGAFGWDIDLGILKVIEDVAKDRGRDGCRSESYSLGGGYAAVLGNCRATPTTELQHTDLQPYDRVVHNGTIANDAELGGLPLEVDSKVIPKVIDRTSLKAFAASLSKLKGSYAIAAASDRTVFLAANYKPLHYLAVNGAIYFSSMERHLAPLAPFGIRPARLEPYTAMDLETGESVALWREHSNRALVICSGGLDSVTAAYMLKASGVDVTLLHFLYGCRAEDQEINSVARVSGHLGAEAEFHRLDYQQFKGASPLLIRDRHIAGGLAGAEYAHEWVPARNLLMLATATAYAEANGFGYIALGNNLEEAGAYPDNEEQFTTLFDDVLDYAVHDGGQVRLITPVGRLMKHEIVKEGIKLGVPYDITWSCYHGYVHPCGNCGPCLMRSLAFRRNGLKDPAFQD